MADISKKRVNSQEINGGGWIGEKYGTPIPGWGDLCLKVRGTNSATYRHSRAVAAKNIRPEDLEQETGDIKISVADQRYMTSLRDVLLLDWENLTDNGVAVKFSKEVAEKLIFDPDNEPFRDAIWYAAQKICDIRAVAEDKIQKN